MKAATYVSAGNLQLLDQPKPVIKNPTDAIVRVCNCWIKLTTHHLKLSEVEKAYDVFKHVGENHALKVIIENDISE